MCEKKVNALMMIKKIETIQQMWEIMKVNIEYKSFGDLKLQ